MAKFVVLCDAAVVTVGKKPNGKPEYARVLRGGIINGSEDSLTIKTLLRRGNVAQAKNREEALELRKHRQTVKDAARRAGAPDDPALEAMEAVQPLPAPNPETNPDAILAGTD